LFKESQKVSAAKSPLSPPADAKAGQQAIVCPSAERSLAHVEKLSGFAYVE
jgi:hypothetical protein